MKKLVALIFLSMFATGLYAQVKISGDAMIRPRYDINDHGDYGSTSEDFYHMYRARINMLADMGDGFYFKTQLAHYGYGGFAFTSGLGTETPWGGMVDGSRRPGVNFMQLYFGVNKDNWGASGGIIPVNGLSNPLLDVHYYPTKMVDVPYVIFSQNGAFGFTGYYNLGLGKLTLTVLTDDGFGKYIEDADGNLILDTQDTYTYALDYQVKVADFSIQPMVLLSSASDSSNAPTTLGLNVTAPKLGPITFSGTYAISSQNQTGTTEYDINYMRLKAVSKLGPGAVVAWYDLAQRTDKFESGDIEHNFSFIWPDVQIYRI